MVCKIPKIQLTNCVDLKKGRKMRLVSLSEASIQPRANLRKFMKALQFDFQHGRGRALEARSEAEQEQRCPSGHNQRWGDHSGDVGRAPSHRVIRSAAAPREGRRG